MITTPFDRRAAQQFDDLLEGRIAEASAELNKLLAFAEQVWAVPAPEPRAGFRDGLRAQLMAAAPAALAQDGPVAERVRVDEVAAARRRRQIAAAVAAFSVAGAATGTAFAAEHSLPGDTLYPVKRLVEDVRSRVSLSDSSKGSVEVKQAHTRLVEATALARDGKADRAQEALQDFVTQAKAGALLLTDAGEGAEIHDFTDSSLQQVSGLADLLPVDLLAPVLTTIIAIDKAAAAAFPGAGDGLTQLSNTLTKILNSASAKHEPAAVKPSAEPSAAATTKAPTGGAASSQPSAQPSSGSSTPKAKPSTLGGVVGSVGDGVGNGVVGGAGKAVDGVGKAVGGPVGDVVSGLGQTVEDLGQAVDGLLSGVGSALDGPTATSTKSTK